jgi:hypothetical protein
VPERRILVRELLQSAAELVEIGLEDVGSILAMG